ncbi:MAG: crossover junction endodeoxyribonuclease RuvC [Candidatus Krumholzibacteria bacterium]|nr:crossover junction endodeoxyribonuclease RuvC [Candidatus Krumholzibacteria bacterium]
MPLFIGIDPGSRVTGYGIVETTGQGIRYRGSGVIRVGGADAVPVRLVAIKRGIDGVIAEHHPAAVAVEDVFISRNPRSALTLGQARGVILLAAAEAGIPVFEYAPREVKSSVTGIGSAHKSQVAAMVVRLLRPGREIGCEDESDALAVAFCHALRAGVPSGRLR